MVVDDGVERGSKIGPCLAFSRIVIAGRRIRMECKLAQQEQDECGTGVQCPRILPEGRFRARKRRAGLRCLPRFSAWIGTLDPANIVPL